MTISLDPQTERHLAIFKTLSDYEQSVVRQAMEQIATEAPTDSIAESLSETIAGRRFSKKERVKLEMESLSSWSKIK
jgi:predicted transcriptional regulator